MKQGSRYLPLSISSTTISGCITDCYPPSRFVQKLIQCFMLLSIYIKGNNKLFSIILIILSLNSTSTYAQQTLEISFKARHYEGQALGLDSILIKNINRNCDTTLYAPDTILNLLFYVGMDENKAIENSFNISQNYPNPVIMGKTSVDIFMPHQDRVFIKVFDITGNLVTHYNIIISNGMHTFDFYIENRGTYLLTAMTGGQFKSVKIMSLGNKSNQESRIEYGTFKESTILNLKTKQLNGGFWFEPGDTLWYVGYANTPELIYGSDVMESAPLVDTLISFKIVEGLPCPNNVAVKHSGYLYPTVQINEQCWLKENMNIGTMINGDTNMTDNGIIEKYCYDNESVNCAVYGGLYQWDELMQYSTQEFSQGICPFGWHISTYSEWEILISERSANELKEKGDSHWLTGNSGNNSSGFTALPAGYRGWNSGSFDMIYEGCDFFTSTEYEIDDDYSWARSMYYASSWIGGGNAWKTHGLSIRCLKD